MRRTLHLLTALVLGASLLACDDPEVDEFRSEGGSAPDPTGVIEGTVLYVGPRPQCEYRGGVPVRPIGRVILTLFEYDNPPPPSGGATSAENLLTIPGSQLFSDLADCLPEGEEPGPSTANIMRSVAFIWPEIELERDHERVFQIRGFYDYDADFNPFFSVTNQPTRGDVGGGAFISIAASPPVPLPIALPSQRDAPNGAVNDSPTVTLGAVVRTERPVFEVADTTTALDAQTFIPPIADVIERERQLYALTNMKIRMIATTMGTARAVPPAWQQALDAAGLRFDLTDPRAYAWYVDEVDADGDGGQDLHPILGSANIYWFSPVVIMRRVQSPAEMAVGFPDALLIGSVRPTQILTKQVFYPSIDIVVAPVTAVALNPALPYCRVPYLSAGNVTDTLERIPVACHEQPTGAYAVNVLHGNAGGSYVEVPTILSDTGWNIAGGSFAGQAWSVPNELGNPDQLSEDRATGEALALRSQSNAGRFIVYDSDPSNPIGSAEGAPGCETALDPSMMAARTVNYLPVPDECCAPILKFCGLPLCGHVTLGADDGVNAGGRTIVGAGGSVVEVDGERTLDCVPFHMPVTCCPPS